MEMMHLKKEEDKISLQGKLLTKLMSNAAV